MPRRQVIADLTSTLDAGLRGLPRLYVGREPLRVPAFLACGVVGYVVATSLAVGLAAASGRSPSTILLMAGAAAVTFFAVAITTKVLTGEETLTFLNHAAAVVVVVSAGLVLSGRPVAVYLDLTAIALLVFLAFGRVGCFLVGCCHGRPHHWGARYTTEHVAEGFPSHLAGVPVVPVPLLEAAVDVVIATAAAAGVVAHWSAGTPLAWSVVAYSGARILLEQLRGDRRHHALGLSTGQWSSGLATVAVVLVAARADHPHLAWWIGWAALVIVLLVVIVGRNGLGRGLHFRLDHPDHLAELASALRHLAVSSPADGGHMAATSVGVRLTRGGMHYACSTPRPLPPGAAARLGERIVQLAHPSSWYRVLQSELGTVHVLVEPGEDATVEVGAASDGEAGPAPGLLSLLDRLDPEGGQVLLAGMQQAHGNAAVMSLLVARTAPGAR